MALGLDNAMNDRHKRQLKVENDKKADPFGQLAGAMNSSVRRAMGGVQNNGANRPRNATSSVGDFGRGVFSQANTALDRIRKKQEQDALAQQQEQQNQFAPLFGEDQQSMINDLLNNEYMTPRSAEDISSFARQGADEELAGLMSVLDQIVGAAQGRYKESDSNLESMYGAHQEDVRTNGVANQRAITETAANSTEEAANSSVGNLQQAQTAQNNSKSAMLENLGIQAAAAQPDEFNALEEAQGQIQQGNSRSQNRINEMGAANEAAMGRMAETIGLEGAGQRSALERQFGDFTGDIDMQRAQYQQQHAEAMRNLMMQSEAMANQERQQYGQFQYGIGSDMLNSELDYVNGQAGAQAEAAAAQQEFERDMQMQDRKYELESGLARTKSAGNQRQNDPTWETFKAMLGQEGADPQVVLEQYLQMMNQR